MKVQQVISAVRQRGWKVLTRVYELNIIGVRSDSTRPNAFDDQIVVFYKDGRGIMAAHFFPATTDPGTFWLRQPLNPQGTAILAQGQYANAYGIGLHRGQYEALVQKGNVRVIRDYDRDAVLDFANGREATGRFGINIHHASQYGITRTVDKHSAGCQVFADIDDFKQFMSLCKRHRDLYGNQFTYTLIDQRAINRNSRKRLLVGGVMAFAAIAMTIAAHQVVQPTVQETKQR